MLTDYRRKILRKLEKNHEIPKKISEGLRTFLRNFTLNLGKVCRKSVEFESLFRECLKVKTLEL